MRRMPRWRFDFAPHDLGRYPHADGQVYGGGEKTEENQMPVEESSNMIILAAAIAKAEGNTALAQRYWPTLTKWAAYLKDKGLDPENQLSTDDFAGHLAHNANLSIKAIVALGAYAQLAESHRTQKPKRSLPVYRQGFCQALGQMAADGDHYVLAFDKPGTWSQKYNLVWDRVSAESVSAEIARKRSLFTKRIRITTGFHSITVRDYTKLDWIYWTATLPIHSGISTP